jgi:hypothetical protein
MHSYSRAELNGLTSKAFVPSTARGGPESKSVKHRGAPQRSCRSRRKISGWPWEAYIHIDT